ncbi:uncharacterized protein L969DRAFT_105499 [Mixia osmundae IAM 14324]|uniref:Uncharacterized protein n=1 Tax=Mixia osmundae (strain CBS 9802 / IAM 14324 / JCM 22182 / KY 12970) TaxID=764103 RepID=G7E264_MIXOS|nr:uncharacterized protein L969DRAFT_105499 [Mixia osmundae IAM 14324]KEI36796.1 hypothetical protein L969DRAFT_105499 [Mixia osmundae IAM 14324]GAA96924.1 hypothetical protein E5Q_03598 [Mixia osmundae IAM 14324]
MSAVRASLLEELLSRPNPPLSPKRPWKPELSEEIGSLPKSVDLNIRAALHLLNDDIEACHDLAGSQEGNPYSNHLHAILHRREPDYPNSKYWFKRSQNPMMMKVYGGNSMAAAQKAACAFVDEVEEADKQGGQARADAEGKQWQEITQLARGLIDLLSPSASK